MLTGNKERVLEWCGCYHDKDRSLGGRLTYATPDNIPIDFLNFQPSMLFYEQQVFPKLFKDKMELKFFTFHDDLNDKTFWFLHIVNRCTYEVAAANVVGALTLTEATNVAVLMYIDEVTKET